MSRNPSDLWMGVDMGTSACRVCVLDADEQVRHMASTPLPAGERANGQHAQLAADWWQALHDALQQVPEALRARTQSVLIAGTSATVLACDARLAPLGPALMYDDARATLAAAHVDVTADSDSAARGPSSALAKLLHLAHACPQAAHILPQAAWLTARLLGHTAAWDENNALKFGYDAARRCWPTWVRALWPTSLRLPAVVPPGTELGGILPEVAATLGLPGTLRILAGTTDSTAAFVAAGAQAPGDAVSTLGSTLVLKQYALQPVSAPAYGVYSHRLGNAWSVGGASNTGGTVLARYFTPEQLQTLSRRIDPNTDSPLDYYPLPTRGERFPEHDPLLEPRLTPRPADDARFLHGLLQGLARIEAHGYARLRALGAPPLRRVLSSGGGAVNDVFMALRARLLGVPVLRARHTEAAVGAALLARRAAAA